MARKTDVFYTYICDLCGIHTDDKTEMISFYRSSSDTARCEPPGEHSVDVCRPCRRDRTIDEISARFWPSGGTL
jgi:hypothetical protein